MIWHPHAPRKRPRYARPSDPRVSGILPHQGGVVLESTNAQVDGVDDSSDVVMVKSDVDVIQYVQNVRTFQNGR